MAGIEGGESLTDMQEDELQALKAIYEDAVKDLRENDAWKVSHADLLAW